MGILKWPTPEWAHTKDDDILALKPEGGGGSPVM